MATIENTRTQGMGRTHRFVWVAMAAGDDGAQATIPGAADRVVQVIGTLDGAQVIIEGSCERTPSANGWAQLTDLQGNSIAFTSPGIEYATENTTHIRPRIVGGGVSTDVTVILLARRTT